MILAARNQVISDRSLIDAMTMFHGMGFDAMELSIVRGLYPVLAWDYLDDYVIDRVNEVSDELNFPISAVSCHQNCVQDDETFEAQKKLIRKARRYRTDIVIVSTFMEYRQRENSPEVYRLLTERMKELCRIAQDCGVKLAIEIEPNQLIHNFRTFFRLAEEVDSPALKMNFDVGHIYLSEVDLVKAVERAKDYIVYSHIDNMCMGEHCHKLPWDGDIDLPETYRALRKAGYDGAVSLDIYLQDYEKVSPQCVKYIRNEVFAKL